MNEAQRQQLLRQMRGLQTAVGSATVDTTRFEREIYRHNLIDQIHILGLDLHRTVITVGAVGGRAGGTKGTVKRDPMFDLELEFSDNGDGYGNPLVNPTGGGEYFVRCRIRQHQADPLVQGFQLAWTKPTGWSWVDGLGGTTTEEANSNPLVVTRVARAPGSNKGGKFNVVVLARYL